MIRIPDYPIYEPQYSNPYASLKLKMQFVSSSFSPSSTWSQSPSTSPLKQTSPQRTSPQQVSPQQSYLSSSTNTNFPCRNWELGKCVRGDACRYAHVELDGIMPNDDEIDNMRPVSTDIQNEVDEWNLFDHNRSLGSHESASNDYTSDFYPHSTSPTKKECWDWVAGRCSRGPTCKFSHDYVNLEKYGNKLSPNTTKANVDNLCHQWSRMGHCQYGDLCKFAHPNNLQMPPNGTRNIQMQPNLLRRSFDASANADFQSLAFLSSVTAMSPQAAYRLLSTSTNTEICRFYAKHGRCKYSNACKFFHIHPVLGLQLPNLSAITAHNNQLDSKSNSMRQLSANPKNTHFLSIGRNHDVSRQYENGEKFHDPVGDDSRFSFGYSGHSDQYSHSQSPQPVQSQSQTSSPNFKYGFDEREVDDSYFVPRQDNLLDIEVQNIPKLQMSRNISIDDISDADSMFYAATNSALNAISDTTIDSTKFSSNHQSITPNASLEYDMSNLDISSNSLKRSETEQSSEYSSILGAKCTSCGAKSCVYLDRFRSLCWKCCPCLECGQAEGKAVCAEGFCSKCYQPHFGVRLRD